MVVKSPAEIHTEEGGDAEARVATEAAVGAVVGIGTEIRCPAIATATDEVGADTVAAAIAMVEGTGPAVVVMLMIQLLRLWERKWWSGWEESYGARSRREGTVVTAGEHFLT